MTEKRFVYYEHEGADYILDTPNTQLDFIEMLGDCLEPQEIVDLLNNLSEENEQLKNEIEKITYANEDLLKEKMQWEKLSDEYAKLYEENEELKEEHKEIIDLLDKKLQENDDNDEYARRMKIDLIMELKKEFGQ